MNGRPVDGFVRKAVARTAEDIGPSANDKMEVVELFLLTSAWSICHLKWRASSHFNLTERRSAPSLIGPNKPGH